MFTKVNIDDSVYIIPYLVVFRIVKNFFYTARNPSLIMIKMQK